ncbi:MAG: MBL fold metallo-hydrolase [Dehalococcoidales bacterium]|nr:MAG: MBL fold metallo-hydrolase [Dehalococcoidales bacterium]
MQIKLSFLGAAGSVTGSRYLLETDNLKLLVECGLYQERELSHRNWDPFPVPPRELDAILLTHAHLDHCGLIPKLVAEGFRGKIYCTAATSEVTQIILLDSARLQEEDAAFKKRRHERERRKGPYPEIPLYTVDDANASFQLFSPVKYGEVVQIGDGVKATFHDIGHVLGSSAIKVTVSQEGEQRTIVFSGDIGREDKPILRDPSVFTEVDYVLVESTYGDRQHKESADTGDSLATIVNSTWKRGGNIIVPSFALQRSQEILYHLNNLLIENRIPHLMVFLDSPMAIRITEVFKRHTELFDKEMSRLVSSNRSPFDFPGLKMVQTADESKSLNHILGTIMIIAGSGMCTGGRIKHHLVTNISRRQSTILFTGYQAFGTLGRHIVDGAKKVRILGKHYPVKAKIAQIHGFSSHADRYELLQWLSELKRPPRRVFVVHGETKAARQFGQFLSQKTNWDVSVPEYGEEVYLV